MVDDKTLRQELVHLLIKKQAHLDFKDVLADFPEEHINTTSPNCNYSFWHVVEHLRLCQKDNLEYIVSTDYKWPSFPNDYWPEKDALTDAVGWQKTIDGFLADRQALIGIIQDPETDLFAALKNSGEHKHSILREINIIASHNAHHTGSLVIMRQSLGIWP